MAKGKDTQKAVKKKSEKSLKEKRNEKKEKKSKKDKIWLFNQMNFETDNQVYISSTTFFLTEAGIIKGLKNTESWLYYDYCNKTVGYLYYSNYLSFQLRFGSDMEMLKNLNLYSMRIVSRKHT